MKTEQEMYDLGFDVREWGNGYEILNYVGYDEDVVIPEGVTMIRREAFKNKGITKVTFPKSLLYINAWAFKYNNLTEVDLSNVKVIGRGTFRYNPIKEFTCDGETYKVDEADEKLLRKWGFYQEDKMITMEEMYNLGFRTEKYMGGYKITRYVGESKDIVIPGGVLAIDEFVFCNRGITSVKFPDSLVEIDEGAFAHNKLTKIDLKRVTYFGDDVFYNNNITELIHKRIIYNVKEMDKELLAEFGI